MSMTEKLLNKIRQKLFLRIMTKKIFHMTMLIMKKMRMKHFHMTKKINNNNNKQTNKQIPKLYVLQYICQKKIVQNDTNILLQKKIKERDASASLETRLCLFSRSLQNFLEKECDIRISRCIMPVG